MGVFPTFFSLKLVKSVLLGEFLAFFAGQIMNKSTQNPEKRTILIEIDRHASAEDEKFETEIIYDFPYPHCILPDGFFHQPIATSVSRSSAAPLLSIRRDDGREILSVIKRQ